ncbi:MAG: hypothetical protein E2O39_15490 [Planctomycetota bacterium]|nr:MAG: hypothetical protein E2O39_15490 [Planctomycetota bacterium]
MRHPIRPASLALAALLLSACASFRFESQAITLRPDPESDALIVEVLYRGVHASSDREDAAAKGAETIARLAAGRRHFIVFDWFFELDLDALEPPADVTELERRALAFITGITVERSGLFVDEHDRLGAYQRFRIANFSAGLELANDAHTRLVLDLAAQGEQHPDVDDRTWELWQQRANAGGRWFVLDGDTIEYRAPLTSRALARLLEAAVRECLEEPDGASLFVGLLDALTEIAVDGELAVFRFEPGPDGRIHLDLERPKWIYSPELRVALEQGREAIDRLESADVRARLRRD